MELNSTDGAYGSLFPNRSDRKQSGPKAHSKAKLAKPSTKDTQVASQFRSAVTAPSSSDKGQKPIEIETRPPLVLAKRRRKPPESTKPAASPTLQPSSSSSSSSTSASAGPTDALTASSSSSSPSASLYFAAGTTFLGSQASSWGDPAYHLAPPTGPIPTAVPAPMSSMSPSDSKRSSAKASPATSSSSSSAVSPPEDLPMIPPLLPAPNPFNMGLLLSALPDEPTEPAPGVEDFGIPEFIQ